MASRLRGEIDLDLDKPRVWRINLLAIERIEQEIKKSQPDTNYDKWTATMRDWSIREWALFLWAGLARTEPQLTQDQIMEMMSDNELSRFKYEIMQLRLASLPDEAKKNLIDTMDETQKLLVGSAASSGK